MTPRCSVCGTAEDLVRQMRPSSSGTGFPDRIVCALDAQLPADPDNVPDGVTQVLMHIAGRDA